MELLREMILDQIKFFFLTRTLWRISSALVSSDQGVLGVAFLLGWLWAECGWPSFLGADGSRGLCCRRVSSTLEGLVGFRPGLGCFSTFRTFPSVGWLGTVPLYTTPHAGRVALWASLLRILGWTWVQCLSGSSFPGEGGILWVRYHHCGLAHLLSLFT